jgi:myo-inositol-1(or 4)-monophosphatase
MNTIQHFENIFILLRKEIIKNLPIILKLRNNVRLKSDGSYVTKGDLLMDKIVSDFFLLRYINHEIISEEKEQPLDKCWDESGSYIIVDPIDGTENFVSGLKEWGVGISIYTNGKHKASCIYLPELDEILFSGQVLEKHKSRIIGLSSSLNRDDLMQLPEGGFEYRIIGCSMYNMLAAIKGSFVRFENVKGVNCWDILPGLNLALEHGVSCYVDEQLYKGELLFPTRKYKIKLINS